MDVIKILEDNRGEVGGEASKWISQTKYTVITYRKLVTVNWLVGMLLVCRSRFVEEDAFEVFHYYGFHLSSSFLMYSFKSWNIHFSWFILSSLESISLHVQDMAQVCGWLFAVISNKHGVN